MGLVAKVEGGQVTLFNPGDRQATTVAVAEAQPLQAGTIRVEVLVDLPVPHGLPEESLARWVAALADPVLRTRGAEAARDAGLDDGAFLPADPHAGDAPAAVRCAVPRRPPRPCARRRRGGLPDLRPPRRGAADQRRADGCLTTPSRTS